MKVLWQDNRVAIIFSQEWLSADFYFYRLVKSTNKVDLTPKNYQAIFDAQQALKRGIDKILNTTIIVPEPIYEPGIDQEEIDRVVKAITENIHFDLSQRSWVCPAQIPDLPKGVNYSVGIRSANVSAIANCSPDKTFKVKFELENFTVNWSEIRSPDPMFTIKNIAPAFEVTLSQDVFQTLQNMQVEADAGMSKRKAEYEQKEKERLTKLFRPKTQS